MLRNFRWHSSYKWNLGILIVATIANYWFWQILRNNIFLLLILLVVEFALFILVNQGNKTNKILLFFITLTLVLIPSIFLIKQFDRNLNINSPSETYTLNQRHGYLAEGLGVLFTNKISQRYYLNFDTGIKKYLQNVSYTVDPNLYFFRSHPREKSGIDEYEKYSPFVLPLFIIGVVFILVNAAGFTTLLTYSAFAILITGLISPGYKLGPILMFPVINIILFKGFVWLIQRVRKLFNR